VRETPHRRTIGAPVHEEPDMARPDLPSSPESVALRATRRRMAFAWQATLYVAVCTGLVLVWAMTPATRFWPGFVIVGWGAALLIQALAGRWLAPGAPTWARIHAEELDRARRAAAR
jgi:hypothetical protein